MTKQEYYDKLVAAAKDGTFPSYGINQLACGFSCRYRADRTPSCKQRCAIGILIPDDKYNVTIEGCAADNTQVYNIIKDSVDNFTAWEFETIQAVHDNLVNQGRWSIDKFIKQINNLDFFAAVNKVEI